MIAAVILFSACLRLLTATELTHDTDIQYHGQPKGQGQGHVREAVRSVRAHFPGFTEESSPHCDRMEDKLRSREKRAKSLSVERHLAGKWVSAS